jgi:D-amino-acid dehydrogenase
MSATMGKKLLVIGGGVIGLNVAWFASQHGHTVELIERNGAARDMASLGNAGMIVPSHFTPIATPGNVKFGLKNVLNPESPFYIKPRLDAGLIDWGLKFMRSANPAQINRAEHALRDLSLLSRKLYLEYATAHGNSFGLEQRGLLMLCDTEDGLKHEADYAAHARALGIPADVLTPEQVRALDPGVSYNIVGAVHFPQDCHLSPNRFVADLERLLVEHGATLCFNQSFDSWVRSGDVITGCRTRDGVVHEADAIVIAGGVWSGMLSRDLGVRLPMQGGKGYSLTLSQPRELPAICSILVEARAACTPMLGHLRFGGTMEIAGRDESISPNRVRGIVKAACRYYGAFQPDDFARVQPWVGLRPVTPDGLPYLGRLARHPHIHVAAGHAMLGLSLAPATGLLMSQVLSDQPPALDLAMYAPERFG